MASYKNITIDLPERIATLDRDFSIISKEKDLEVTYLLMKLYPSFLAPYERISKSSHAKNMDMIDRSVLTKHLRINDLFNNSKFISTEKWLQTNDSCFSKGVVHWYEATSQEQIETNLKVGDVLSIIRNALAHSNIYFGGEYVETIEHAYLGSNWPKKSDEITILRCSIKALEHFVSVWLASLAELGISSKALWPQLEGSSHL